jgi:hypothetical protein
MKTSGILITCACLFMVSLQECSKATEQPFNAPAQIRGKIETVTQFGILATEQNGVLVSAQDTDPAISSTTDNDGNYILDNIPTGTYNFLAEKQGYGTSHLQGLALVGGHEPLYIYYRINEKSTTLLNNITLSLDTSILNYSQVRINGVVSHTFPYTTYYFNIRAFAFLGKTPGVSSADYVQLASFNINVPSGSNISEAIYYDKSLFPSGSTMYARVYGVAAYDFGYLDAISNKNIYTSLNENGSDVAFILLP